jgi:hypothetical protein
MIISLDNLAHRYNLLPSEALDRGTSFDLYVLDVSTRWYNHQQDTANGKSNTPRLSTEEMLAMIDNVRKPK